MNARSFEINTRPYGARHPQKQPPPSPSPAAGALHAAVADQQSAVKAGDVLYKFANLDSVSVYLDIYERDLSAVRYGQTVEIATEAYPARRLRACTASRASSAPPSRGRTNPVKASRFSCKIAAESGMVRPYWSCRGGSNRVVV